jgi:hypothetical protein
VLVPRNDLDQRFKSISYCQGRLSCVLRWASRGTRDARSVPLGTWLRHSGADHLGCIRAGLSGIF